MQLNEKSVLVVDEAGMAGSRLMAKLTDRANAAGAKVVLVGDTRQCANCFLPQRPKIPFVFLEFPAFKC